LRNGKREPVPTIPPVVRLVIVRVEPTSIVITVRVEQVRITIGLRERSSVSPPFECSQGCIVFGISFSRMTYWGNALISRAKYLLFWEIHAPPYPKPWPRIHSMQGYWFR